MSGASFPGDPTVLAELPAESALIALATSRAPGQEALRAVLERPIDWARLMALAARERAIVALNDQLAVTPVPTAQPAEVANLQRLAMIWEFQLASLHDRLGRMLALYASHDIDVLLLKGAGLAYSAYSRPTERPMGDVDALVRGEDATRAWELALANGWVRRSDVSAERSYAEHQHLPPLEDADGLRTGLELHTALFTQQAPFQLPPDQMWESARRLTISGYPAYVPGPEDQLVHAALHFAWSHEMTFGAFRTIRDVERIIAHGPIDWAVLVRKARASRGATCCYWTLRLARDLAGVEVPVEVLEELGPKLPKRMLRSLTRFFAEHALPNPDLIVNSVSLSRAMWSLGVRPRSQGHGRSRPWLDTEEWVRLPGGGGMQKARASAARRFIKQSFGLLRTVGSLMGP
ncbi:MAG TPA: nucleotidyltransferase family protein [Gemmatimonadaceae bacterium]|nr:nucleotidyltransferase family protein [Gemmatimonadaceae bacterium]